jgi:hypothetical protein
MLAAVLSANARLDGCTAGYDDIEVSGRFDGAGLLGA